MVSLRSLAHFLLGVSVFESLVVAATNPATSLVNQSKYAKAHSLGEDYQFDPRDGWQNINATDLAYKYRRDNITDVRRTHSAMKREHNLSTKKRIKATFGLSETISGIISGVFKGLKAIGKPQTVLITWYISSGPPLVDPSYSRL